MSVRRSVLVAAIGLCACAAPARTATTPSAAPMQPETDKASAPALPPPPSTSSAGGASTTGEAAPTAMSPDVGGAKSPVTVPGESPPVDDVPHAQAQFEANAQVFTEAGSDCAKMCKALASMQRSAEHLCELTKTNGAPNDKRCNEARSKVDHARDRVMSTCGGCDS